MSSRWLRKIIDTEDLSVVLDSLDHYDAIRLEAQDLLKVKGKRIDQVASAIPGNIEYYFGVLQELETILKFLEYRKDKAVVEKTQWFMTHYQRSLTEGVAKKYAENHADLVPITQIVFEVVEVRNLFLSLFKGIETLHYQIKNITDLRKAGLDDAEF